MKMEEAFEKLFTDHPELKEADEREKQWRKDVADRYIAEGMGREEAIRTAWADYWKKVKEEDGFEFSIHVIDRENPDND